MQESVMEQTVTWTDETSGTTYHAHLWDARQVRFRVDLGIRDEVLGTAQFDKALSGFVFLDPDLKAEFLQRAPDGALGMLENRVRETLAMIRDKQQKASDDFHAELASHEL